MTYHLARRLFADLGQPGQPQGSEQRDLCEFPPGHRRSGRQFGVHPRDGRWPLLLPDHRRYRRTSACAGRPDHGLRGGSELADHRQLQSRPDLGSRLRAGRDRSSRHLESHQYRGQRPGRHHLFRRLGRGAISVVRTAQGAGTEGRVVRRCGNIVRLYRQGRTSPSSSACQRTLHAKLRWPMRTSRKATASRSTTSVRFAPRSARAFFGRRRWVRFGSTLLIRSSRVSTTRPSSSISRAALRSEFSTLDRLLGRVGSPARLFSTGRDSRLAKISFFPLALAPTLRQIAEWTGAALGSDGDAERFVRDVAPLDVAGPDALSFLDNPRYLPQLKATRAAAVFLAPRHMSAGAARLRDARDRGALSRDGRDDGAPLSAARSNQVPSSRSAAFRRAPSFTPPRGWSRASWSIRAP